MDIWYFVTDIILTIVGFYLFYVFNNEDGELVIQNLTAPENVIPILIVFLGCVILSLGFLL